MRPYIRQYVCLVWELQTIARTFPAAAQEASEQQAANGSHERLAGNGAATNDPPDLTQRMGAVSVAVDPEQRNASAASDSAVTSTGNDTASRDVHTETTQPVPPEQMDKWLEVCRFHNTWHLELHTGHVLTWSDPWHNCPLCGISS